MFEFGFETAAKCRSIKLLIDFQVVIRCSLYFFTSQPITSSTDSLHYRMSIYSMLLLVAILLPLLSSLKSSINFRKSSIISYQNQYQLSTSIQLISHSQPARYLQVRFMSMTDEAEDSTTTETDIGDDGEEILDDVEVVATNLNATDSTTTNTTEPIDPKAEILKAKISALTAQERQLENAIATERLNLLRVKDKVSESGKTGYFIVQAQVAEFLVCK